MSYPKDLDEYSWLDLQAEINERLKLQHEKKCDYCRRPLGCLPACRFPERHSGTEPK